MSTISLEERLTALESELRTLKDEVRSLSSGKSKTNWIEQVSGSMAEFPDFDEVVRLGAEWRKKVNEESLADQESPDK
jgi:uncharacterized small protein (DUF1192 family)